jgi:hypothetical protein
MKTATFVVFHSMELGLFSPALKKEERRRQLAVRHRLFTSK